MRAREASSDREPVANDGMSRQVHHAIGALSVCCLDRVHLSGFADMAMPQRLKALRGNSAHSCRRIPTENIPRDLLSH